MMSFPVTIFFAYFAGYISLACGLNGNEDLMQCRWCYSLYLSDAVDRDTLLAMQIQVGSR